MIKSKSTNYLAILSCIICLLINDLSIINGLNSLNGMFREFSACCICFILTYLSYSIYQSYNQKQKLINHLLKYGSLLFIIMNTLSILMKNDLSIAMNSNYLLLLIFPITLFIYNYLINHLHLPITIMIVTITYLFIIIYSSISISMINPSWIKLMMVLSNSLLYVQLGYLLARRNHLTIKLKHIILVISLFILEIFINKLFLSISNGLCFHVSTPFIIYILFKTVITKNISITNHQLHFIWILYLLYPLVNLFNNHLIKLYPYLNNLFIEVIISLLLTFILASLFNQKYSYQEKVKNYQRLNKIIDLKNLNHNIDQFHAIMQQTSKIMPVLKGDAYSHGSIEIGQYCQDKGMDLFAVACLKEAIELRNNGIYQPILILNDTHPNNAFLLSKYRLIQSVSCIELAKAYNNSGYKINIALAINTGMNRNGFNVNEYESIVNCFHLSNLSVLHIYSHLCDCESLSEESKLFTYQQIKVFNDLLNSLKQDNFTGFTTSLQASFGVINYPELKYDYVRLGIALYGIIPTVNQSMVLHPNLKPIMSIHCYITSIHEVEKGQRIGYAGYFIADKKMKVATISIGYVDGLFKEYQHTQFEVKGNKVSVVGKICMDSCIIDITNIDDVNVFDKVDIINHTNPFNLVASSFNTNAIELVARLGKRYESFYIH